MKDQSTHCFDHIDLTNYMISPLICANEQKHDEGDKRHLYKEDGQ
jgi:hypothetical protein